MPGALGGVYKCEKQRVNGPLCTGMNGAPDEGDTHQLALMTGHFLHKQALSPHTHTRAQKHTHACTHLLAPALRASGKLESLVDWGKGEEEKT